MDNRTAFTNLPFPDERFEISEWERARVNIDYREGLAGILCRAGAATRMKGLRRMTQGQ